MNDSDRADTGTPAASLTMSIRPALGMVWFHYPLTRPFVDVDGVERPCRWGTQQIPVSAGQHQVTVFYRYYLMQGSGPRLSEENIEVDAGTGTTLTVRAKLPASNQRPFRIEAA